MRYKYLEKESEKDTGAEGRDKEFKTGKEVKWRN